MSIAKIPVVTARRTSNSSSECALGFLLSEAARFRELGAGPERIRRRIHQLLAGMNLSASGVVVDGVTEMVCEKESL